MKQKIKGLSLFSNVGIAETYLEDLNIQIVVANELNKKRCSFYSHLYPKTQIITGDIRSVEIYNQIIKESLKKNIDFIIATPPCQGMSSAGKMDNNDPRNYLITDTIKVILDVLPKYVFLENVPEQMITRIKYKNKLVLIPEYIKLSLQKHYIFNSANINTMNYGVPQNRKRSIFLLTKKTQKLKWNFPKEDGKVITLEDSIGHLPSIDPLLSDISYKEHLKIFPEYEKKLQKALSISPFFKPVSHVFRQVYALMHTPSGKSAFQNPSKYIPKKKNGQPVKGFKNTYKRMSWKKPCNTITTYNRTIGSQENVHPGRFIKYNVDNVPIYSDARVLTIYELLILYSLPTNWNIPNWASENLIRTVIGEGVPPLLVKKIFTELKNNLKK